MVDQNAALAAIEGLGTAPPNIGLNAQMAPILAAGVDLARRLLIMISGAVCLLTLLLGVVEWNEQSNVSALARRQIDFVDAIRGQAETPGLRPVIALLEKTAAAPTSDFTPSDAATITTFVGHAIQDPLASEGQRALIARHCTPLPPVGTPNRDGILRQCATTLGATLGAKDMTTLRFEQIQAVAKSLESERAAHRAYWLQVAQLVLINLLLPILTALLGYIFGTQQGSRTS